MRWRYYASTKFWGYKNQLRELREELGELDQIARKACQVMTETEKIARRAIDLLDKQAIENTTRVIGDLQTEVSSHKRKPQ